MHQEDGCACKQVERAIPLRSTTRGTVRQHDRQQGSACISPTRAESKDSWHYSAGEGCSKGETLSQHQKGIWLFIGIIATMMTSVDAITDSDGR